MVGFVVVVGIVFYGVMYSGLRSLAGDPITTLEALTGNVITTKKPAASTHGTTVGQTGYTGGGGPGGAKKP